MKMTLRITAALLLILLSLPALAERVTMEEAWQVGENFLADQIALGRDWSDAVDARVLDCREVHYEGQLVAYWLPVTPVGNIIVSVLKELPAVKAWSADSNFDPDAKDGFTLLLKQATGNTLDILKEKYGVLENLPREGVLAENRQSWDWLLNGGPAPRGDREMVGPLVPFPWHQEGPYWNDCPDGDGGRTLVGCVATSASLIMKYWEYPAFGEGSHSYNWDGDDSCGGQVGGGNLYVDFGDAYDWDNVLYSYTSGYSAEEAAAVAELSYELAVAFDMDFGHCGSGAYVNTGAAVYTNYMRCADSAEWIQRSAYSPEEWYAIIVDELSQNPPQPMHYRIHQHSIVCDGYQNNAAPYYHMNYGWGGGYNSWYALDNVHCDWPGCDVSEEGMILGIVPIAYFDVTAPDASTVWHHGEVPTTIVWSGSEATQVFMELYKGDLYVAEFLPLTANDGTETPTFTIPSEWGTGSDFRIRVMGDDDKWGWSEEFGIYGAGGWTDASSGSPLADLGEGQGIAWGDCDGDSDLDIYLSQDDRPNSLFSNEGGSTFVDITGAPINVDGRGRGVVWGDLDNDGDLDLYLVQTSSNQNYLFRNDGTYFTDVTAGPLGDASFTSDVDFADYNNDGLLDMYIVNIFAQDKLFRNDGNCVFTDVTAPPLGDTGRGRSASWGDFDNDGDQDLYVTRSSDNKFYRNEGGGVFTNISTTSGTANTGDGYGAAWGDYDNDSYLDLYITNVAENVLYHNNGDGTFTDVSAPPLNDNTEARCGSWADYDNDGWLDLYLANEGDNKLFHNEGGGVFTESTDLLLGDDGLSQAAAWGDYDGDGDLDIYMSNDGTENHLFRNDDGSGNHWLHIDLQGTTSNFCGVGARIRVVAGALEMIREVDGGDGYLAQNSLTVEFGLGDASMVDLVEITWPSGNVFTYNSVPADQKIMYTEDATAIGDGIASPLAYALLGNHPNPFNPTTEISFSLPEDAEISLQIFDITGRRVKTLVTGSSYETGTHTVTWNGRDDRNRELASGVYFYRLEAGGFEQTKKMTLLK
jgi:hypothetical protein